ncbi:hypothetical protein GDR74_06920 [Microvirga thermotolerans]|uniref:Uncharacterized protein n=1 Tax=Microvirga thermotolerans TaxID=2651334 RepID=A0A5P9JXL9_9HYPH|nr:hypothetical protein GDR74_06920 [Microvirga thermotolerans]
MIGLENGLRPRLGGRRDRGDGGEFLVRVGFLRRTTDEGAELGGELRFDGGPRGRLHLRARGGLEGRLETLGRRLGGGSGHPRAGDAHDVGFDHDVVGAADQQEVLHVVTAQQDELALPVEIVDVDHPQARLAAAAPVMPGEHEAPARELAKNQTEESHEYEDDREGDEVLGCP